MYTLFVILVLIASVLMCLVVLIQESNGGGLASGFASGNQLMGVRKTTDVIERVTWGLAIRLHHSCSRHRCFRHGERSR